MACNFSIPFSGTAENIINKAKLAVVNQGGTFNGDTSSGIFGVNAFGSIKGTYTISGNALNIQINSKPMLIPCSTIEGFLKKQLG